MEDIPLADEKKSLQPTNTLRSYFDEEEVKQEEFVLETQQDSKDRS